ncbi:WD40 repeat domain-containing protein [Tuwongella immobilis]|uniref:Uncharacterized protein n=1 Tax=Tuwongella immobilis TaxID=692036 RepID=A0A6C2YM19_9BACT|nr:hypothetical protein [Tuwongella immobilis]VIP02476.1 wd-40 repeat-containing protein : Uncultured bacterium genome assembly Metasoil_fosmids_resub OS=uncultured bacterium PE=4 SV=1: WD40 [Tuwongella immobilis]VTS01514.1 wd-40 repeat-containing protein : Uncultured bacterium genome assembly Metasoil_fosmids_resub OS=uncultured bacterium PE=4 SV=1: WD40 [Tuwongella immobilis]
MPAIDPSKAKSTHLITYGTTFYAQALDPTTGKLYVAGDDTVVSLFDLLAQKKEPLSKWTKHDNYISTLSLRKTGDKTELVSGSFDRSLIWWDTTKGEPTRVIADAHQGWIRDSVFTPSGDRLITVGDDMLAKVWDANSGKLIRTLDGHPKETPQFHVTALYDVAISADGKWLATGDRIGEVRVWELDTGKEAGRFSVPTVYTYDDRQRKRSLGGIRALAFSRDGKYLAVGGMAQVGNVDGLAGKVHLEIWDWQKPQAKVITGAENHVGMIASLQFHPTEPWLVGVGGGGDNAFIAFWNIKDLANLPPLEKKPTLPTNRHKANGFYHRAEWTPDGKAVVVAGYHLMQQWTVG